MDLDTDVQLKEATTDAQVAPENAQNDELADPLAEGGDESVQMILPPKPGAGPKATDSFQPIEDVLADEAS